MHTTARPLAGPTVAFHRVTTTITPTTTTTTWIDLTFPETPLVCFFFYKLFCWTDWVPLRVVFFVLFCLLSRLPPFTIFLPPFGASASNLAHEGHVAACLFALLAHTHRYTSTDPLTEAMKEAMWPRYATAVPRCACVCGTLQALAAYYRGVSMVDTACDVITGICVLSFFI